MKKIRFTSIRNFPNNKLPKIFNQQLQSTVSITEQNYDHKLLQSSNFINIHKYSTTNRIALIAILIDSLIYLLTEKIWKKSI